MIAYKSNSYVLYTSLLQCRINEIVKRHDRRSNNTTIYNTRIQYENDVENSTKYKIICRSRDDIILLLCMDGSVDNAHLRLYFSLIEDLIYIDFTPSMMDEEQLNIRSKLEKWIKFFNEIQMETRENTKEEELKLVIETKIKTRMKELTSLLNKISSPPTLDVITPDQS